MPVAEQLDPVTLALANAPVDDEPETEEERKVVELAKASLRANHQPENDRWRLDGGLLGREERRLRGCPSAHVQLARTGTEG